MRDESQWERVGRRKQGPRSSLRACRLGSFTRPILHNLDPAIENHGKLIIPPDGACRDLRSQTGEAVCPAARFRLGRPLARVPRKYIPDRRRG